MSRLSVPALLTLLAAAPSMARGGESFDFFAAKIVLEAPANPGLPGGLLGGDELEVEVSYSVKRIQPYIVIDGKVLPTDIVVEKVAPHERRFVWTGGTFLKAEEANDVDLWEQQATNLKGASKP